MPLIEPLPITKPVVLVGLMGSGKTTIGSRLAKRLNVPFFDSDKEIEKNEGRSISDIFAKSGEAYFREIEKNTIQALITHTPIVLATGGGAFIQAPTRALIKEKSVSIWLKAELGILLERVSRKNTRPLLEKGDKRAILTQLIEERYPFYAEADLTVDSGNEPHYIAVEAAIHSLAGYFNLSL